MPGEWTTGSPVTACPSLSLNVPVEMLPSTCKTFTSPVMYCIGNLQFAVGGLED